MYAIVEIAGQQFKVEKGSKLFVNRLDKEEGSEVKFENVLLVDNDDKITVGTPKVEKANVSAKVLQHVSGDTVLVFKKKRRKGYQTLNGHRQKYTEIEIQDINA
ncbi:MAG: 50S ribosomal protein L21 [Bacteroidales bacterium]|nr:50S ribosomal protein L21 [Bacteroidales bacterium]